MGRLVWSGITSLDGYLVDSDGSFAWAAPDEEVHRFANEMARPIGTQLYGRRMYEVMAGWEDEPPAPAGVPPSVTAEFGALWRAADKVVYSTTLPAVSTRRTRLERAFDPAAVRAVKAGSARDVSVGGAGLAAHAVRAGLVDEIQLFLTPVLVGGGTPFLPAGVRVPLELLDERRFAGGTVWVRYRVGG